MLVLSRKKGETILIGDDIEVRIIRVRGGRVKIGIDCPNSIPIDRYELLEQKLAEQSEDAVRRLDLRQCDVIYEHELHLKAAPFCVAQS